MACAARPVPLASEPASASTAPQPTASLKAVARLRRDLNAIFSAEIMDHGQWAVVVRSAGTGERLFERNGGKLMMPASNMKIVTLAAAAESLGWDARFTTTLEADGSIDAGVLRGDLYVRGGGDPTINTRDGRGAAVFAAWTAALAAAGINRIEGRIIGDDNLFDDEALGAGWAWDYLQYGYAAPIGALQYNEDVVTLVVTPGVTAGAPAMVTLSPGSGLSVTNKAVTAAPGTPETIDYRRFLDRPVLEVTGVVPLAAADTAGAQTRTVGREVAVINPTLYFVQSLKSELIAQGISVAGEAVDIDDLASSAGAHAGAPGHRPDRVAAARGYRGGDDEGQPEPLRRYPAESDGGEGRWRRHRRGRPRRGTCSACVNGNLTKPRS